MFNPKYIKELEAVENGPIGDIIRAILRVEAEHNKTMLAETGLDTQTGLHDAVRFQTTIHLCEAIAGPKDSAGRHFFTRAYIKEIEREGSQYD